MLRGSRAGDLVAGNTFTKWITAYPEMAGIVGGDVGDGVYSGGVLSLAVTDSGMTIDASYHFEGARHSFTALVHVVQTGLTTGATAAITGVIFDGWMAGHRVAGEYTQIECSQSAGGCFAGSLDIFPGSIGG